MDCRRNDWYIVPCSDSETIFYQKKDCFSAIGSIIRSKWTIALIINILYKNCILFYRSTNLFKYYIVCRRVSRGADQGAWAPLEIEKQKKKKGFQILGPSPYEFLDTRPLCMLYCMYCIIYYIIIMFPSFLIQEKNYLLLCNGKPKKINHLENLDLDM